MEPIIATILLVAIVVVLAAVLYALVAGLTSSGVGTKQIGSAFAVGGPTSSKCPATYTYATNGCLAGDYFYNLTVETAGPNFGSVLFEVRTSGGGVYTAAGVGGFTILTITGKVAAQMTTASATLAMTSSFRYVRSLAGLQRRRMWSIDPVLEPLYHRGRHGHGQPHGPFLSVRGDWDGVCTPVQHRRSVYRSVRRAVRAALHGKWVHRGAAGALPRTEVGRRTAIDLAVC